MNLIDNQITALYSNELFRRILCNQQISLIKFNAITNFLVYLGIPYDVSFDAGTRKEAASFQLTIHINPTHTEVFVVALEPGSSSFAPSP